MSFLSAGRGNAETLILGLEGGAFLVKVNAVATEFVALLLFPFRGLGGEIVPGGDADSASVGLIDRIDVEEVFR